MQTIHLKIKQALAFFCGIVILMSCLIGCGPDTQVVDEIPTLVEVKSDSPESSFPEVNIHYFSADQTEIQSGECVVLKWQVEGGFGVGLHGQQVDFEDTMEVCPEETTEYTLFVDQGDELVTAQVIVHVESSSRLSSGNSVSEPSDTLRWVDGSLLVYIPPGEFIMGHDGDDSPEHAVYVDGFWIYRTEVTVSMYMRCVAMGECSSPIFDPTLPDFSDPANADLPILSVRWRQAENYCNFVGGVLPTEAQWEKTARGTDARIYPWGNSEPNCDLLNYNECLGEPGSVISHPEGSSPYGAFDMAGNVFEWVSDWYDPDYYYLGEYYNNPIGPESGWGRSIRGGAFTSASDQVISALRTFVPPEESRPDLGFRCVVANAEEYAPQCEVIAHVPPDAQGNAGSAPGGSASCIVQEPALAVVTYCHRRVWGNNITWTPANADISYSALAGVSCSQYDADTLACSGSAGGAVEISACLSCPPPVVELGVLATCDPPYTLDEPAGICRYAGAPVEGRDLCAPQFSLSAQSDSVCCEMKEGDLHDFPVCPIGGSYDPVTHVCWFTLPSTGDKKCINRTVYFYACTSSGGSGGTCTLNQNTCGRLYFCASTCSCVRDDSLCQ